MISRRKLLQTIAALTLPPQITYSANTPEILLGGSMQMNTLTNQVSYFLSCIDLNSAEQKFISTSFLPHGLHQHPLQQEKIIAFEKKGNGACEISLKNHQVIRNIPTIENRTFYGHGTYTSDGRSILSTEVMSDLTGVIGIRDANSLQDLGFFPSFGNEPHECKLINKGKTLAVTNAGSSKKTGMPSEANIAFIDISSKKLLKRYTLTRKDINAGHISISDEGDVVVASAPQSGASIQSLGGVSLKPQREQLTSELSPQSIMNKMIGEALSIAISNKLNIAAITHPQGNMITFWDIKTKKLINHITINNPRGVTLSRNEDFFYISYGSNGDLLKLPSEHLNKPKARIIQNALLTGSHIYNLDRINSEQTALLPI